MQVDNGWLKVVERYLVGTLICMAVVRVNLHSFVELSAIASLCRSLTRALIEMLILYPLILLEIIMRYILVLDSIEIHYAP